MPLETSENQTPIPSSAVDANAVPSVLVEQGYKPPLRSTLGIQFG